MPLGDNHLGDAARLVTGRFRAERQRQPLLPEHFESPDAALPLLRALAAKSPGVAAVRDGRLVGFLVGFNSVFREARTAYVPNWGHAADACDTYRQMYADLSRQWVANVEQ